MPEDWMLTAISEVERTARIAGEELETAAAKLGWARAARQTGVPVTDIVQALLADDGRETRQRASAAVDAYEHAVMVLRSRLIRALVEDEAWSLAEVSRRMGISRQMVARLYRRVTTASRDSE
jgi:AraC-like DNA-binding protein